MFKSKFYIQLIIAMLFPFIFLFTKNEFVVTAVVAILLTTTLLIAYEKGEWKILLVGIIAGIVFELGGDIIAKMQYWENGSFFGIPLWLPLLWGLGFIVIRRVGNRIINK